MLNIYVGHSKKINYHELYTALENNAALKQYNLIFPHKESEQSSNTRDFYKTIDIFVAEVSMAATGLGIELGWANDDKVPIYCFYKEGLKISNSLHVITDNFIEYRDLDDFNIKLTKILNNLTKES